MDERGRNDILRAIGIIDIVFGVIAGVALWWYTGLIKMHVIGAYSELDSKGVISREMLRDALGDRLGLDWWLVATEFLQGRTVLNARICGAVIVGVVIVQGIMLLAMARRVTRSVPPLGQGQKRA